MLSSRTVQQLADIEEGIPLWGCLPGSPSSKAGLQYGDIILWINEHRVKSVGDYARAIGSRTSDEVKVRFLRNGEASETVLFMADKASFLDFEEVAQHIVDERMVPIPREGDDDELPQA